MDVMKPKLITISGRCYRVNDFNVDSATLPELKDAGPYYEPDESYDDDLLYEDKEEKENLQIETAAEGLLKAEFHVPRDYFPPIVGSRGAVRKRLEDETKVQIKIPRLGQTGPVIIIGADASGIRRAYRRVRQIVVKARNSHQITHFISIRCTSGTIKDNFMTFKKLVLEEYKSLGICESIFQTPEKLHVTVAVLVLIDQVERAKACKVFQDCRDMFLVPSLQGKKLTLNLKGLEIMNDDPGEVSVLYAKVKSDDDDLLQKLADGVNSFFEDYGLLSKQFEKVKLHATLMNTSFDRTNETEVESSNKKRKTFDATKILTDLRDFEFGSTVFQGLDLSTRFSTADDGYYKFSASINFTSCRG